MLPTTYVRVDLAALRHNYAEVLRHLAGRATLMPVVKANAYGYGLVEVARLFAGLASDGLGVASIEEGIQVREAGIETPVLVFHPPTAEEVPAAAAHRLTVTVTQESHLHALADLGGTLDYEVALDVGLGRSGWTGDPVELLQKARKRLGRLPVGVWTHLGPGMVPADLPAQSPASWQAARTVAARLRYLEILRGANGSPSVFHVSASTALCTTDRLLWDRVRIGSLLYGAYPAGAPRRPCNLQPALELRTRIVELRTVPRGTTVGYGAEFRARRPTRLATLPVGLTHGVALVPESVVSLPAAAKRALALAFGRWGRTFRPALARLAGGHAPLVGRVSLNDCTIDVTDLPAAHLGEEVVVPARMTTLNPALPRVYESRGS